MADDSRFVWIDLEMTGLDENTCAILQVAMIITEPSLQEISTTEIVVWQPETVLTTMVPFVRDMHTKNGLLRRVRASNTSLVEAQDQLMAKLTQLVPYKKGILAGNSIYMDRKFLERHMSAVTNHLHYRQLDVSSIKILAQEWFGEKAKPPKKENAHTALEDIRESINELRFYRSTCFKEVL